MPPKVNHQWRLAGRPQGLPVAHNLEYVAAPLQEPGADEVLLEHLYLSMDPALRVYMHKDFLLADQVIRGWAVGRVVASNSSRFPVGSYARDINGVAGIQEYSRLPASELVAVDPHAAALPTHLGALGMPGLTAYFAMLDLGRPEAGQTVVVSAAAGAVGAVAGQIARIKGARVIGIAGGSEKCRYLTRELGFAGAIDYKSEPLDAALRAHCPAGMDVYFDNVGGPTLDACLLRLAPGARIVACGALTTYNGLADTGIRNYAALMGARACWQGFSYYHYVGRSAEALKDLAGWIATGRLKPREDIMTGMENFLPAVLSLFRGENFGKLVLKIGSDDE